MKTLMEVNLLENNGMKYRFLQAQQLLVHYQKNLYA